MFDFLKSGKATMTVTVDRPVQPYYVGEMVRATIDIQAQKELNITEARAQLVCKEEYQYRCRSTSVDSDGSADTDVEKRWATDEQVIQHQQLLPESTLANSFKQTFEFVAPIPVDAPPTCENGKIVRVTWLIKATLARKMARDVEATAPIRLLSVPTGKADSEGEYGFSNEPDEAMLSFDLPSLEWCLGDTVKGKFLVHPQKVFDVSEVRLELVRQEHVHRDMGNTIREVQKVKLAGRTRLQPGQALVFPFSIAIPKTVPVTMRTHHISVTWSLTGVLARSLRRDTCAEQEMFVFSERP
ncbi:MAG: sporulation protein [Anaerolineae bacterium]